MAEMTSKQRLLAAIAHQEPDRVPISPRMHIWAAHRYGSHSWLRQLKLQETFDTDPLIDVYFQLPNYIVYPFSGDYRDLVDVSVDLDVQNQREANVVRRRFQTPAGELTDEIVMPHPRGRYGVSPTPSRREPLVKTVEDVDKIRYLMPDPRTKLDVEFREIVEIIGDRGLLQVHPRFMLSGMTGAIGMEDAMVAFYQNRELFDDLLQIFGKYFQQLTKAMLEWGAPVVFVSWHNFGVSAGWSPTIFRQAFKPWLKANVELVHSYDALYTYFDNGPVMPLLPELAEVNVDIVSSLCPPPVGDVDLAKAKRAIGDHICLHGNVDAIWVVQRGTPTDVRQAVREAICVAAPGGGFILGNSDCFFDETPDQNVEAFFEAAHAFGQYPLDV